MTARQRINELKGLTNEQKIEQKNITIENTKTLHNPTVAVDTSRLVAGNNALDRGILYIAGSLKNVAFLFSSLADLALACFFYWSLGFDNVSKAVLAVFGFVQTGCKIWGWSWNKQVLAIWCAALSVFATISIFLAIIDTQSINVSQNNMIEKSAIVLSLENQLNAKINENKSLNDRLINTPTNYIKASNDIASTIKANDETISKIQQDLRKENIVKVIEKSFELDAWKIFSQLPTFDFRNSTKVLALLIILMIAGLLEVIIWATAPRKL